MIAIACGSSLPSPATAEDASIRDRAVEVPFPPPPARVEFIPEKPRSGAVWIDGEWSWTGRRWAWIHGRWVIPPPDATFARWRTERTKDGTLLFASGMWLGPKGQELSEPEPLAMGAARQEDVVTPPGHMEKTAPNRAPASNTESQPQH